MDSKLRPTNLQKPPQFSDCNHCGYCCSIQPCQLAEEFLACHTGPCVALELVEGLARCGLVRNPLGYLYQAAKPGAAIDLSVVPDLAASLELSKQIADTLGIGKGCDAVDDADSVAWNLR